MKKIFLALLVVGLAFQVSASLKNKQILGNWKYEVDTGSEKMTGLFKFVEKEGKLAGEVVTDDGYTIPFTKIEIQEENKLYLELKTENDLIKVSVKVDGESFTGMGSSYSGDAPIKGKKVKE